MNAETRSQNPEEMEPAPPGVDTVMLQSELDIS